MPPFRLLRCPRVRRIAPWLAAALLNPCVHAGDLRTAPQEHAEPHFIISRVDGRLDVKGFCVDLLRTLERGDPHLHFSISPQVQSLPRIGSRLASGDLDAFCGLPRTPQSETHLRFIEPPLYIARFQLAVRADDRIDVRDWDDVQRLGRDGLVLVASGSAIGQALRERGLKIDRSAGDPRTNIQKLLAGRGRFFLHPAAGLRRAIRAAEAEDRIRILPAVMEQRPFYLVLSERAAAESGDEVRKALARTAAGGELDSLRRKWEME